MLRSALNFLVSSSDKSDNEFVGQTVVIGSHRIQIHRVIAEGGFAFVYEAAEHGERYALKRLIAADREAAKSIQQEIATHRKLSGHPNIVRFVQGACHDIGTGRREFLLLMELCSVGPLVEILKNRADPLDFGEVLRIFHQTCKAVQHMHSQRPPLIHRDLKVENLLISEPGIVKLCDFGSATSKCYSPNSTWSSKDRCIVEEQMCHCTTPMYRAPEMLDLYQNFPINQMLDIWALGCLLYFLCFRVHPFEDASKLKILNRKFSFPANDKIHAPFCALIDRMLQLKPNDRPTIDDVITVLEKMALDARIDLRTQLDLSQLVSGAAHEIESVYVSRQPVNTIEQSTGPNDFGSPATNVGSLIGSIMGQTETTSRPDLDLSYITSRLIVMSCPDDGLDLTYRQSLEELKQFLELHHRDHYAVYNLSDRHYNATVFSDRVSVCPFVENRAPPLELLLSLCKNMYLWLKQNPKNVCALHCPNGKENSATVICSFFVFSHAVNSVENAVKAFADRRCEPNLRPSQERPFESLARQFVIPLNVEVEENVSIIVYHARSTFGTKVQGKITAIKMFQLQFHCGFLSPCPSRKTIDFPCSDLDYEPEDECRFPADFSLSLLLTVSEKNLNDVVAADQAFIFDRSHYVPSILFSSQEEFSSFRDNFCPQPLREVPLVDMFATANRKASVNGRNGESYQNTFFSTLRWEDRDQLFSDATSNAPVSQPSQTTVPEEEQPVEPKLTTAVGNLLNLSSFDSDSFVKSQPGSAADSVKTVEEIKSENSQKRENLRLPLVVEGVNDFSEQLFTSDVNIPPADSERLLGTADSCAKSDNDDLLKEWTPATLLEQHAAEGSNLSITNAFVRNFSTPAFTADRNEAKLLPPQSAADPFQELGGLMNSQFFSNDQNRPTAVVGAASERKKPMIHRGLSSSSSNLTEIYSSYGDSDASTFKAQTTVHAKTPTFTHAPFPHYNNESWSSFVGKTKIDSDAFNDLLDFQGFKVNNSCKGNVSLASMKHELQLTTMSPDELKVHEWTEGKRRNIRGLLCSLHTILWPENTKWEQVSMSQLLTAAQVKKFYRKACLAVHPDKVLTYVLFVCTFCTRWGASLAITATEVFSSLAEMTYIMCYEIMILFLSVSHAVDDGYQRVIKYQHF
ncbi:unnamed protein product [Soboliphyme baturini]|uniref:Protein kinase domain-containing protein n=1 Tax=Soboliphyme baturini TaxID=241478 RepID=A0A183IHK6_9BILA|nr:unnamed protein product [Soboliphyme baturini]